MRTADNGAQGARKCQAGDVAWLGVLRPFVIRGSGSSIDASWRR